MFVRRAVLKSMLRITVGNLYSRKRRVRPSSHTLFFVLLSCGSNSFAFQSSAGGAAPCRTGVNLKAIKDVVEKSPKDPADDRGPLLEMGPKLGLSPQEIKRIRETTGKLHCAGPGGISGTATLVGDGSTVVTVAHAFIDEKTGKNRFAKPDCTFTTLSDPPITRKLMVQLSNPNLMILGKHYPIGSGNDYAIVKLDKPIFGVNPFPIDLSSTQIPVRQKTYVVSALQKELSRFDPTQPIVETCEISGTLFGIHTMTYQNRCHVDGGASGGSQYQRSASGQLVFKAVVIEGGKTFENPLDPENGNLTKSLGVESEFLADVKRLDPSIAAGQGAILDLK